MYMYECTCAVCKCVERRNTVGFKLSLVALFSRFSNMHKKDREGLVDFMTMYRPPFLTWMVWMADNERLPSHAIDFDTLPYHTQLYSRCLYKFEVRVYGNGPVFIILLYCSKTNGRYASQAFVQKKKHNHCHACLCVSVCTHKAHLSRAT